MLDLTTIACVAVAIALFYAFGLQRDGKATAARKHGAAQAKRVRLLDPIFGLDFKIKTHAHQTGYPKYHARHGKTFLTRHFVGQSVLSTVDPENIQTMMGRSDDWGVEPLRFWASSRFCGDGFLVRDGRIWRDARKAIKPSFYHGNLCDFSELEKRVGMLVQRIPNDGTTVDLQPMLEDLFLDIALYFLLGRDSLETNQNSPMSTEQYFKYFKDGLRGTGLRIVFGNLAELLPKTRYLNGCDGVHTFINYEIDKALKYVTATRANNRQLSMVESLVRQGVDKDFARGQLLQTSLASLETTSSLVSNAVFLLARSPVHWQRLRTEAKRSGKSALTFEACSTSDLLRSILLETLRLYPVFPMLGREALRDTVLPRGGGPDGSRPIFVPENVHAVTSFYTLHRDPSVFGDDVEAFRPERWVPKEEGGVDPSPWEFMPFGGGERSCLGRSKAVAEAAYVLSRLALEFEELQARDEREWTMEQKLTCKNKNGCKVAFKSVA